MNKDKIIARMSDIWQAARIKARFSLGDPNLYIETEMVKLLEEVDKDAYVRGLEYSIAPDGVANLYERVHHELNRLKHSDGLYEVKVGDFIRRQHTGAIRRVLAVLQIEGENHIVSQYLSSNSPRVDSVKHLRTWEYGVVADKTVIEEAKIKWAKKRGKK